MDLPGEGFAGERLPGETKLLHRVASSSSPSGITLFKSRWWAACSAMPRVWGAAWRANRHCSQAQDTRALMWLAGEWPSGGRVFLHARGGSLDVEVGLRDRRDCCCRDSGGQPFADSGLPVVEQVLGTPPLVRRAACHAPCWGRWHISVAQGILQHLRTHAATRSSEPAPNQQMRHEVMGGP